MMFKRWIGYEGLCLYVMGPQWRVSISRRIGSGWVGLNADKIFTNLDDLRSKLQLGDVMATSLTFYDDGRTCLIRTAKRHGLVMREGRLIVDVLTKWYPTYSDIRIRWRQDIRQYT